MAGTEIGNAFISVGLSTANLAGDIRKVFGQVESSSGDTGRRSAKSFAGGFVGAGAVAGIASSLTTQVTGMFGGFISEAARASDATNKFKSTMNFAGLKTDAIDKAAVAAQKYADQTVFDLPTIQNTIAQLASNGIKDYTGLTKAAGNLNAVAGGNQETFKSVAMVMTQTAGAGKLTTENWNQLSDAIPGAAGPLMKAMKDAGAYTGNFREAMEKGQITSDEFNAALMKLGTQPVAVEAAKSTKTFEGALGNLRATITNGLTGALNAMKPALTGAITGISTGLGRAFNSVKNVFDLLVGGWENAAATIKPDGMVGVFLRVGGAARTAFNTVKGGVSAMTAAFKDGGSDVTSSGFAGFMEQLGLTMRKTFDAVGPAIGQIGTALLAALPSVVQVLSAFSPLGVAFNALLPVLPTLATAAGQLGAVLAQALGATLQTLAPILAGVVTGVANAVTGFMSFKGSAEALSAFVIALVGGLALYKGVVTTISAVTKAWSVVQGILNLVMAANPITLVIIAIAALIAAVVLLVANWDSVVGFVTQIWGGFVNWLKTVMDGLVAWWSGLWTTIGAALNGSWSGLVSWVGSAVASFVQPFVDGFNGLVSFVSGIFQSIGTAISGAWNWVLSLVTNILISFWQVHGTQLTAVWNTVSSIFSAIGKFIADVWNGIVSVVSVVLGAIWGAISAYFGFIWSLFIAIWSGIFSFIAGIWNGIVSAISAAVGAIRNWIVSGFTTASNTIRSVFGAVAGFLAGIWNNIISGVSGMVGQIGSFFGSIWGKVTGAFAGAGQWLFEAGRNVIQGLLDGAGGLLRNIGSFFLDMVPGWIVGPFKQALGIHSPSRVFRQFGEFIIQGLVVGVKKTGPKATAAITSVAKKVTTEATRHFTKADQLRKAAAGLMKRATGISGVKAPTLGKDAKANARKMDAYYSAISRRNKRVADLLAQGRQKIAEANRESAMGRALDATARMISSSNQQIARLTTQRTNLAARLKTAQKGLADATKTRDKAASDAAEKFRDTFDLGDLAGRSAQGIVAAAKKSVASVQGFKGQLDQLRSLGLDSALMAQIGDLGVGKGGAIAKSLIAGGKGLVSQLNGQWKQLGATSQSAGMSLANGMYGAGIAAQQGLVNGLAGNLRAVDAAVKKVTDRMTSQVRKNLGIHSPSRVFRQIGVFTGQGFVLGVGDMESDAKTAMDRLTSVPKAVAAQPSPSRSMEPAYSRAGAAADRGPTEIHVHETANPRATAIEVARRMEGK